MEMALPVTGSGLRVGGGSARRPIASAEAGRAPKARPARGPSAHAVVPVGGGTPFDSGTVRIPRRQSLSRAAKSTYRPSGERVRSTIVRRRGCWPIGLGRAPSPGWIE